MNLQNAIFVIDPMGFWISIAFTAVWLGILRYIRWREEPRLFFSSVDYLNEGNYGWKVRNGKLPFYLEAAAMTVFLLAMADPHFLLPKQPFAQNDQISQPTEGIAISLVLDRSGSMSEEVSSEGSRGMMSKIDLLKQVTKQFIEGDRSAGLKGRPNDLIGMIAFSRGAEVLAPLTLDHRALLEQLQKLTVQQDKDQDGTSIGYAIFKTANMIAATRHYAQELKQEERPAYEIKSSVIVLVTDGLQDPNPLDKGRRLRNMDIPEAAAYAKANGIRLYIVNVEPKLASEEYAPNRRQLKRATENTGGQFFMVGGNAGLKEIYREIDRLEKSKIPIQSSPTQGIFTTLPPEQQFFYARFSLYPFLIGLGMCCLFAALFLHTIVLRRIP
jgi:Ca-activated chloride channel family protein